MMPSAFAALAGRHVNDKPARQLALPDDYRLRIETNVSDGYEIEEEWWGSFWNEDTDERYALVFRNDTVYELWMPMYREDGHMQGTYQGNAVITESPNQDHYFFVGTGKLRYCPI